MYTPGAPLRALSTSHIPSASPSPHKAASAADETPRLIRKKSGQPVKSSLKSSTPRVRGSLSVVTLGAGSSKSAPSTPTLGAKSRVHFDTHLEHVKLFLAEQKPLAVSRDGSPTEDTSGTEGDFPDWIFGNGGAKGRLEMLVDVPAAASEVDVKLQELALAEDGAAVVGRVAVRNLAFDKWVAVRFTFDAWQTTSEVTARYVQSLPSGAVDVFAFSIRLNDLLARIEGKTMMLAVRYTSAGREMWDNNGGAIIVRPSGGCARRCRGRRRGKMRRGADGEGREGEVLADLRSRLERVVKAQEPGPVKLNNSAENKPNAALFKNGLLASRYDFGTSSREPWRPSVSMPANARHQRAQSHPVFAADDSPSPLSTIPWPTVAKALPKAPPAFGSPRAADDDAASFMRAPALQRHHQRGYFDVQVQRDAATLRRTPPGTPGGTRVRSLDDLTPLASPRYYSFPPLDRRAGLGLAPEADGWPTPRGVAAREVRAGNMSEESTPSFVSSPGRRAAARCPP
ncbi:putative phosphatase regulatory subunit-domain-containing protein [Mycena sp. CBHHK59/15]|nr:putative phosphatase regulatory subunit-domain-containing protein [Mycena sp. CBHHK59/15]